MEKSITNVEEAFQKFANEQQMCLSVNLCKFSELFPDQEDFIMAHFKTRNGATIALRVMSNLIGGTIQKGGKRLSFEHWNTSFVIKKLATETYAITIEHKEAVNP
jgi:hypothetical protein